MKSMIAAMLAFLMALCGQTAEKSPVTATLTFAANPTTGYTWTAFVLSGDAVEVDEGTYTADPQEEPVCGGGGETAFVVTARKPGQSLVRFAYYRPWEADVAKQSVVLMQVTEDMHIIMTDITCYGVLTGTVTAVDPEEHSVIMATEQEELLVQIPADMVLPVLDEAITVYTDGTMTMSLPPMVSALAWETFPDDAARDGE